MCIYLNLMILIKIIRGFIRAERGADTRLIQDYLGHRNIRHTVRYTASNAARFAGLWERNNLINEKLKREEV